jgi:hypothetical protein
MLHQILRFDSTLNFYLLINIQSGIGFMYMNNKPFQISNNGQISYFRLTYSQKKQLMMASADRATHGYDNLYPSMRGVFIARGAAFKTDFALNKHIEMVDVFPLVCHTLGIECEPRNGSLHRASGLFKSEHSLRAASARSYEKHDGAVAAAVASQGSWSAVAICLVLICCGELSALIE